MNRKLILAIPLILLILVIGVFSWAYLTYLNQLTPRQSGSPPLISFTIDQGEPGSSVANHLEEKGLVKSAWATTLFLKFSGQENQLKPGTYRLSPAQSTSVLIQSLIAGPLDIKVTFPEGWRREQIAGRLASALPGFSASDFLGLTSSLEGRLFPDTYFFSTQATPAEVVKIMTANFTAKSGLVLPGQMDALILASLVEREAKTDPDRRLIAGIILKRLAAGMPLQVDATVQYAADTIKSQWAKPGSLTYWQPITDTHVASPFNTYLYPGLPPAPICNPGLASIQAALQPRTSPYLYYLTDAHGVTHYSATLDQHNLNVDKFLSP